MWKYSAGRYPVGDGTLYVHLDPLSHGVLWSMAINAAVFIAVSMLKAPEPIERLQALVFVPETLARPPMTPSFRRWRTSVTEVNAGKWSNNRFV